MRHLNHIRNLLNVQFERTEEDILKDSLWHLINNKIFFQDQMACLAIARGWTIGENSIRKACPQPLFQLVLISRPGTKPNRLVLLTDLGDN